MMIIQRNSILVFFISATILLESRISASAAEISTILTTAPTPNSAIDDIFTQKPPLPSLEYGPYYEDTYVPYRSDSHDKFSWDLTKEVILKERSSNNVILSPFSVKLLLAMLTEATGNGTQTQNELLDTLTDLKSAENLRNFYKKLLPGLKRENPFYTLNLETRLYTETFIEPQQRFAAILHDNYKTEIKKLNFSDPVLSAKSINDWCRNVTAGRLQQLISEDVIQNNVMLITNVIYFNGLWRQQFNDTYEGAFLRTPTEQIRVQFMEQTDNFYYHDSIKFDSKILRLPYRGKRFSMFIVLPKTKGGIDDLVSSLESDQLKNMQWMMEDVKVKVTLPKFKFDYSKNLKETLKNLGVRTIFTDQASLPGLARGADVAKKLKVSNIFQKSGIEVNERGTEAYASTVIEIGNKFGGSTIIEEFNVNRPFLFFIEEEQTGNILFAGKITEPYI